MEANKWRNLFLYMITLISALVLFFQAVPSEGASGLENYSLEAQQGETSFDSGNLTVQVSGNTSLPDPASELVLESVNYSEEEGLLEVQLGSVDTSENGTAVPTVVQEPVPYTFTANFSGEIPESVMVSGVFREVEAFSPEQ